GRGAVSWLQARTASRSERDKATRTPRRRREAHRPHAYARARIPNIPTSSSSRALGKVQPVEDPVGELGGEPWQRGNLGKNRGPHTGEGSKSLEQQPPPRRPDPGNSQQ